jgi:flagellar biosynthesis anti-sigma factor FlgM
LGDHLLLMSAHASRKDQEKKAHRSKQITTPSQSRQMMEIETRLEAMRDGETRIKRLEALQAQVQNGMYQVDSSSVAQKIVHTSRIQRLLGVSPDHVDEFRLADE